MWHLQWCWSPACTCCSAVGPLPSGFHFTGNRNRAKSPSVINGRICAAENTTGLSAAISYHTAPQAKNYITDLQSCSCWFLIALIHLLCVIAAVRLCAAHMCQVGSQSQWDMIRSGLPCNGSSYLKCPLSSALWTFRRNALSLPLVPVWIWLALCFFSIKNVLFLVRRVKTRLSYPVYACALWNNFPPPEGLSGLFISMCWSPVCIASHSMQAHYAMLCISCRATGPERQPATNHSPAHLLLPSCFNLFSMSLICHDPLFLPRLVHVFQGKGGWMVQWFVCVYESSHVLGWSVKAVDCCCHAAWFSLGVLECEGRSGEASRRREDDLSFVVSEILYVLPQL